MTIQQQVPVSDERPARKTGAVSAGTTEVFLGKTGVDEPAGTRGKTSIADVVVVKVAGIAAREIPGVHDMGAGCPARSVRSVTVCPVAVPTSAAV